MLGKSEYVESTYQAVKAKTTKYLTLRRELLDLRLDSGGFVILMHLLFHSDAFMPSRQNLTDATGMGKTAVAAALRHLTSRGVLDITHTAGNHPQYTLKPMSNWLTSPVGESTKSRTSLRQGTRLPGSFFFSYKSSLNRNTVIIRAELLKRGLRIFTESYDIVGLLASDLTALNLARQLRPSRAAIYKALGNEYLESVFEYCASSAFEIETARALVHKQYTTGIPPMIDCFDYRKLSLCPFLLFANTNTANTLVVPYRTELSHLLSAVERFNLPVNSGLLVEEEFRVALLHDATTPEVHAAAEHALHEAATDFTESLSLTQRLNTHTRSK